MKHNHQTGSAHLIAITLICLVILGGLGFVFWQKFTAKPQVSSQSATASNSSQASPATSDLVDYGKDGVTVDSKTPTDINKLKSAPADFVAFIKHDVYNVDRSDAPADCSYADTIEKIYKQTFAAGSFGGCAEGAHAIWAKVGTNWAVVASTQVEHFSCSDLEKYAVPSTIAGTTCYVWGANDGSAPTTKNYVQN